MIEAIKKIEYTFRNSSSQDELFDAFRDALKIKVADVDLYKILLGNPSLSPEEIKMYSKELRKVMPENEYTIAMWTAKVLENLSDVPERIQDAIYFYKCASDINPTDHKALLGILRLYNFEIDTADNKKIEEIVESKIPAIHKKSIIYFTLSEIYFKKGDKTKAIRYYALGEKSVEGEV